METDMDNSIYQARWLIFPPMGIALGLMVVGAVFG
jgi:hypothetical protein